MFSGSIVALTTPFTADASAVDYAMLDTMIERQIAGGTHGIVPCGCTGEAATLTTEEQIAVIRHTIKKVAGRAKVIAGTGSNCTAEALSLSKAADEAGADGVLVITPYYNKPTPEGQYRHYKAVAEAIRIPVMLYNVPGRTGTKILPETVARLRKNVKNIACIKEACGSVDQVCEILEQCDITVLSGDDGLTLPMMCVGATGVVSVVANVVPGDVSAMVNAWHAGDIKTARALHYKLLPLVRAMFMETNPIPVKTALRMIGVGNGVLRMPLCELRPESEKKLAAALTAYGLTVRS